MKWQGLILSEHAEMMERERNIPVKTEILFDEQQLEEFDRIIHSSLHLEREVVFNMNTFGDHDLLQVKGVVLEFCRLPGQRPYVKLKGYSSRFRLEEMVSISFATGDNEYGEAD